jgi:Mg-chelatase subunit ChlD
VVITAEPTVSEAGGLDISGAAMELEITSATTSVVQIPAPAGGGPTIFDGLLPQSDYQVWVRPAAPEPGAPAIGDIAYSIGLERADPFLDPAAQPTPALPVDLTLTTSTPEVTAYWRDGQQVDAILRVASDSPGPLELDLAAATSNHGWSVELPDHIQVPATGALDVPLVIRVPPDAWRDIPVRVTVQARAAVGARSSAWVEIVPRQDALPVQPEVAWPLPDALLGGLDVASLALGGRAVTAQFHEDQAHDGLIVAGTGLSVFFPNGPVIIDADLAGDDPVPVAGTIIDPLGGAGSFGGRPRAFELLLSLDGESYSPVLSGEMGPQTLEQAFVLPEPVEARFARLRVDSSWGGTSGPLEIGEWKVVATPGFSPSAEPFDLADPVRGGHMVWTDPPFQSGWEMLSAADSNLRYLSLAAGQAQEMVIGFADDRAAEVTGFRWQDQAGSDPAARFESVEVEASVESPLGPWRSLGTWSLERGADGTVAPFDLSEPAWGRFIRLRAVGSMDTAAGWELPGKVTILERATDDTYRSILGQWGQASPLGIHEVLVPPAIQVATEDIDAGDTAAAATPLVEGSDAQGRVARGVDTDWYKLTVPADRNTLAVRLDTERAGDVRVRLHDAAGAEVVPATIVPTDGGIVMTAVVKPGATYRVELEQPILSVVFTFDTSGSVQPWFPLIRAAIGSFAAAIRPGLEAVQVFPFEEPDLLEGWSDQAYLVQSAIDAWTAAGGSSALEASIRRAAVTLEERDGTRAVLAIGDAVAGGFLGGLPTSDLERVRPAVFPVHVGGIDDPAVSTHIMQDLALANGGFYQYATSLADMEVAFDRMATWLRRPASYALSYLTSLVEYPPGSIEVVAAEGTQALIGGVAVELVLDTSGSMLKKLGTSTRIDVAKGSVSRLIDETLPEGLPVALRTFKAGRRSCDTVLALKLGPLDRAALQRRIQRLKIDKGTRTPLGAAIAAVAGDIGQTPGPKVVVVVTDGAETCKGDPAAAVQGLVDAGIDTTVNIVGLALDDEQLKASMASWAQAGGGVFFDAQDRAGLSSAIAATLRAPFRVLDDAGTVVAQGVVGGPGVAVPIGTWRVQVLTDPVLTLEDVVVAPGQGIQLTIGGGALISRP